MSLTVVLLFYFFKGILIDINSVIGPEEDKKKQDWRIKKKKDVQSFENACSNCI